MKVPTTLKDIISIFSILIFIVSLMISFSFGFKTPADESLTKNKDFIYNPPGKLLAGSGTGIKDNTIYNSNMRFPIENSPAYCNSQVYGYGGNHGPKSPDRLKDSRNYSYPWYDNFCEKRDNKRECCPNKVGHQGQDIRPATFHDKKYFAVAPEDVIVTHIGNYSVNLKSLDGSISYKYLHLDKKSLLVKKFQKVKNSERIGYISDQFTKGDKTSVHLHFEMRVNIKKGNLKQSSKLVSPYSTLVNSYNKLIEGKELDIL